MATLTTENPVETQKSFSEGSSGSDLLVRLGPTTQVEHREAPEVSTIKEPAIIRVQRPQVLPETRAGFLTRMVRGLRDLAFRMGVGSAGVAHHRDYRGMSLREKNQHKIDLMGLNNL